MSIRPYSFIALLSFFDNAENKSVWSSTKSITLVEKSAAPAVPKGLEAYGRSNYIVVKWDANNEEDLKTYALRYRQVGRSWIWPGRTTQTVDVIRNLKKNVKYEVQVRAIDAQENKSDYSSSVFVKL